MVSECEYGVVVGDLVIGCCPREQVRGETNNLPLSLLEGSKGGL